jgi:hypothetical protein
VVSPTIGGLSMTTRSDDRAPTPPVNPGLARSRHEAFIRYQIDQLTNALEDQGGPAVARDAARLGTFLTRRATDREIERSAIIRALHHLRHHHP